VNVGPLAGNRDKMLRSPAAGVVAAALASLALVACGAATTNPGAIPPAVEDTTLGVGDVFDVRVYGEEELSDEYRVAQDGTIDFPLVGRVEVIALEPPQVADRIAERLSAGEFLRNPQVSVMVSEYNSKRVSVIGAVERAGTFPMQPGLTIVNAISLAGGFSPLASRGEVVVTRRTDGEVNRYTISIDDITRGNAHDFALQPADIVFVPERIF